MKIKIITDKDEEFEIDCNYIISSTDKKMFVGGKMSIGDLYDSLASLILKSYDTINEIIDKNRNELEDCDNIDFESFISELINLAMINLNSTQIMKIDKKEILKQFKEINKKDKVIDFFNAIKKKKDDDVDNN